MTNELSKTGTIYIHERIINNNAIEMFHENLHNTDWVEIETSRNSNVCLKSFFKKLCLFMMSIFQLK